MIWILLHLLTISKFEWRHTGRLRKGDNLLTVGGCRGGEGAKSYDGEKGWSSKNYYILSGVYSAGGVLGLYNVMYMKHAAHKYVMLCSTLQFQSGVMFSLPNLEAANSARFIDNSVRFRISWRVLPPHSTLFNKSTGKIISCLTFFFFCSLF
jgi:hypothetical protein